MPPVADTPLYHAVPTNGIDEQSDITYKMFDNVVKVNVNQRVQRHNPEQTHFGELLLSLGKGESTVDYWKLLLTRQPSNVDKLSEFKDATRLFYSNEEVGNYNHDELIKLQQPFAEITARHSSATAKKYLLMIFQVFNKYYFLLKVQK